MIRRLNRRLTQMLPIRYFSSKTTPAWIKGHLNDPYVKQARLLNYRTRAAFKLIEIDQRHNLFRKPGMKILELGSAPGGWTQVLHKHCHNSSNILAIDIEPMERFPVTQDAPIIEIMQGDITKKDTVVKIHKYFKLQKIDLMLSDIAIDLTGDQYNDDAETRKINYNILEIASSILKEGGTLFLKSFMHQGEKTHLKTFEMQFNKVLRLKPDASRKNSNEIYYLCQGYQKTEFCKLLQKSKKQIKFDEVYKHFAPNQEITIEDFKAIMDKVAEEKNTKNKKDNNENKKHNAKDSTSKHATIDDINFDAAENGMEEPGFFEKWCKYDKIFKDLLSGPLTLEEAQRQKEQNKRIETKKAKKKKETTTDNDIVKSKLLDLDEEINKYNNKVPIDEFSNDVEEQNKEKQKPLTKAEKLLSILGHPQKVIKNEELPVDDRIAKDELEAIEDLEKKIITKDEEELKIKEREYFLHMFRNDKENLKRIKTIIEKEQEESNEKQNKDKKQQADKLEDELDKEKDEEEFEKDLDVFSRDIQRFDKIMKLKGKK